MAPGFNPHYPTQTNTKNVNRKKVVRGWEYRSVVELILSTMRPWVPSPAWGVKVEEGGTWC